MSRKLLMLLLALCVLLVAVMPAAADSNPAKEYCKGSDYTVTIIEGGREVSETVYLDWQVLYPTRSVLDGFKNQGQCISHVNHGEPLYFLPCAHLKNKEIREVVGCYRDAVSAGLIFSSY